MILKHKVSKITEIEIGLDTAGNSRWKRVRNTKLYDQGGLLVISISPGYITKPWADSSPGGMTLAEMDYYTLMSRTNIPNGQIDTTHFSYDEHGNLTSLKNEYHTTYEYDGYNNPIEKCISSDYTETVCHISKYEYDEAGRIRSRIDSAGVMRSRAGRKMNIATRKYVFQYDSDGRIIFDGQYKRVFNNKGQLIEVEEYHESNSSLGDKYEFLYNSENRRVSEQFTQVVSSSWDPKTNIVSDVKTQTTRKYFYYNERGLLEQEKELNKDDKLISLMNYEYEFHE